MAEWQECELTVSGSLGELRRLRDAVGRKQGSPYLEILASLCPLTWAGRSGSLSGEALIALQEERWGCKWGDCHTCLLEDNTSGVGEKGSLLYSFDAPWHFPHVAFDCISRQFPCLTFAADCRNPYGVDFFLWEPEE